jgi:tetratricopeptide (TPR) repeat protein
MSRRTPALFFACLAPVFAQDVKPQQPAQPAAPANAPANQDQQDPLKKQRPKPKPSDKEYIPPEEDTSISATEITFNPLMSKNDVERGDYYFKKGKLRAAESRYVEATKYNDGNSQAWLRLGEAEEKMKDSKGAREAYAKYLETESDAKKTAEIRKRMEKLK